ncbi:hypothetical protein FRC00_013077, partial [Tulasnella sp. 408]
MPYSSPNGSAFLEDLPSQVISTPSKADDLKYDDVVEKLEMTQEETKHYRLYRRRFVGATALCIFAAAILVVAAWLRYAGTAHSLDSNGAYALLLVAQLLTGVAQPFYQALAPRYSEAWFGLRGRVTATMVMSL